MADPSFASIGAVGTTSNNVAAPPSVALGQLIVLQLYISQNSGTQPTCSGFQTELAFFNSFRSN